LHETSTPSSEHFPAKAGFAAENAIEQLLSAPFNHEAHPTGTGPAGDLALA
jgi:hypothetical protein